MDVYELAKKLGQTLYDTPQMARLRLAKQAQNADDEALSLVGEYNLKRMQLAQKANMPNVSEEQIEGYKEELSAEYEKLLKNEILYETIEAQKEADDMVSKVQNMMNAYMLGTDNIESCTHDCSTCGGCH